MRGMNLQGESSRARNLVMQEIATIKALVPDPSNRSDKLRKKVRAAAVRVHYSSSAAKERVTLIVSAGSVALSLAAIFGIGFLQSGAEVSSLREFADWILSQSSTITLAALVILGLRAWMNGSLMTLFGGVVVAGIMFLFINGDQISDFEGSSSDSPDAAPFSLTLFLSFTVPIALPLLTAILVDELFDWASGRFFSRRRAKPLDVIALMTINYARELQKTRDRWVDSSQSRKWCRSLTALANKAEIDFSLRRRTRNKQLRNSLNEDGRRLAAVFHAHRALLVTANSEEDVDRVVQSLINGAEGMLDGDRDRLLEYAPEEITRSQRFREFVARRLVPGVLIISFGLLLVKVPAVPQSAAEPLMYVLMLAGVMQIITGNKEVSNRINEAFGKAVWKSTESGGK